MQPTVINSMANGPRNVGVEPTLNYAATGQDRGPEASYCEWCVRYEQDVRNNSFRACGPRFEHNGQWLHTVFVMTNTLENRPCSEQYKLCEACGVLYIPEKIGSDEFLHDCED